MEDGKIVELRTRVLGKGITRPKGGGDRLEKKKELGLVKFKVTNGEPDQSGLERPSYLQTLGMFFSQTPAPVSSRRKASAGRELAAFHTACVSQLCPSSAMLCTAW